MDRNELRDELKRAYESLRRNKFPTAGPNSEELGDLAVNLAEYDGYIAGLVERCLRGMTLNVASIALPIAIDEQLRNVDATEEQKDPFETRLESLKRTADLLARTSGLPLERIVR